MFPSVLTLEQVIWTFKCAAHQTLLISVKVCDGGQSQFASFFANYQFCNPLKLVTWHLACQWTVCKVYNCIYKKTPLHCQSCSVHVELSARFWGEIFFLREPHIQNRFRDPRIQTLYSASMGTSAGTCRLSSMYPLLLVYNRTASVCRQIQSWLHGNTIDSPKGRREEVQLPAV